MPETPKFRKKSTVKSFFNRIERETLSRENIPEGELRTTEQQQSSKGYVQKWENYATPETHNPIAE
jgi:hypothetical protein